MGRIVATACYRELGQELRKRREAAGLSGADLARRTGWPPAKISRIESGRYDLSDVDLLHYLGFCGVYESEARDLVALCRDAERRLGYWLSPHGQWLPDSLSSLIFHEATADASTIYQPQLVHGLLQTADYARARIAAEVWRGIEDIKQCVRIRMERQRILHVPRPAQFTFFLHEQALRTQVGTAVIMHEQMLKLVLLAALDHVSVRVVLAAAADQSVFGGPFHLFEYLQFRPLAYLDNHATGLFLEDPEYLEPYRRLVPAMSAIALDEGQSREWIATLASEYDRGSGPDVDHRVEEEQL